MITEFIGQGINDETDESAGNHICSLINNEVFTDMNFFVAFMRSKGLREMKPFIKKANREGRKLTVYVGIDEKITSKEALEMLLDLDVDAYIYNSKRFIFHPKVYLFQGQLRNRIIVGSSNLTKTGLFFNVESSVLLDFTSEDKSGMKVLNQLTDYFAPLLDFSSEHLDRVTPEHIQYLLDNSLISIEKYESDEDYVKKTHDETKERFKNPKIGELGQIEITEGYNPTKSMN
jgi:HKD family nuclease